MLLRKACANCVSQVGQGRSLSGILAPALQEISPAQRALAQELIYGTLRWYWQLDSILAALLHKPLRKRDTEVHALLLIALYQLRYGRTGSHLVVSESVDAAKSLGHAHQANMINAVLRGYQRRVEEFQNESLEDAARYAHPQWMIDRIRKDWPHDWREILEANNQRAPMTLRVNPAYRNRDGYLAELQEQDIEAHACSNSAQGIQLAAPIEVIRLPGFAEGGVSVQDEGAQFAATLLDPQPGERILDACAAPGGKTGHLLESAEIDLVALDSNSARLKKVGDTLERLGKSGELIESDARDTASWWDGKPFDRILLDAPCSASGVIRRHPDIRLLRRAGDIKKLAVLQREILDSLWPTLATGGSLLYATCSVMRRENEQVITGFLEAHPDAVSRRPELGAGVECPVGLQLLPTGNAHDGFYYALLEKVPGGIAQTP